MSSREQVVLNGRYELSRRVGRGGMAEVYLARDRLLDRNVAIKILFPEFAADPSFVARFRREAQSAANLNHPNVVGVYDWGKERGTYYIVMEYVDGRTISDLLRTDGAIEPKKAAGIAADVAAALGFAHRKGVVHRDVKPGNVIITEAGEVKVADFGIARAMTHSGEENLTQTGSVMGTATYFSPEQAQGKTVDPRTDLYSLGVVLYEMVSGKPPFSGDSPVAIAYKHVQEPVPPLHERVPGIPAGYEAITMKALAKDLDDRYVDAAAMRADLLRFRDGRPVNAGPVAAAVPSPPVDPTSAVAAVAPVAVLASADEDDDEYEDYDDPPSRGGWFFVAVIALLAVLAVLLFLFGKQLGIFDSTPMVAVPTVVDKPQKEAIDTLRDAKFKVETSQKPDSTEAGIVLSQDPPGGDEAKQGSTVKIVISSGPSTVKFDISIIGMTQDEAIKALQQAGFTTPPPIRAEETDDPALIGKVLRTEPGAGSYPADTPITLVVGAERQTTTTESTTTTTKPTTTTEAPTTTTEPPPTTTEPPPTTTTTTTKPPTTTKVPTTTSTTIAGP